MRGIYLFGLLLALAVVFAFFTSVDKSSAAPSEVIESQEMNHPGIVAELIECRRKKGVLTVKVRVKNTSSKAMRVTWGDVKKDVYLMDEENQKKYFLLKDAEGEFIYSGAPWDVSANTSKLSWFKFPAPPAEITEITVILPEVAPFEDVPIEDK